MRLRSQTGRLVATPDPVGRRRTYHSGLTRQ